MVPEKCRKYSFKNILFPVRVVKNLSEKLDLGVALAHKNRAKVQLLGICTVENYLSIKNAFSNIRKKLYQNTVEHDPAFVFSHDKAEQISEYTEYTQSDLIILNHEDEDRWRSLFSGNFFKKLINRTEVPLLFVKNKAQQKTSYTIENEINLPFTG